jgi:hypothetical protein
MSLPLFTTETPLFKKYAKKYTPKGKRDSIFDLSDFLEQIS